MSEKKMLDHYLRKLAVQIPKQLIGEDAFQGIFETAELLPASMVLSTFGFECPLYDAHTHADFLASFQKKHNGPALLKQSAERNHSNSSVWADVGSLADFWAKQQMIDDFWLEFDIQGEAPKVPSLFFRPLYNSLAELENILNQSLSNLTGSEDTEQLQTMILQLVGQLPDRAKVFQIGAMRSRPVYGVRLCIHEISLDAILTFLEKTPWPGAIAELKDVLIFLQPLTQNVTFSIDLSDGIGAKIGLECYMNPKISSGARQAAWIKMIDKLAERGMVDMAKASSLKTCDANTETGELFSELPEELILAKALMERHAESTMWQYLHHIKLTYNSGHPLQTKAYLAVQHIWR